MKLENVSIFNSMRDGIRMQLFLENIARSAVRSFLSIALQVVGIVFKNGRAGKAKKLGFWKKLFDGLVVFA